MDLKNSALLPHILESLSQKPELCDTYENLCEDIKYVLSSEDLKNHYGDIQKAIDNALDVGQNLGVITLTDDLIAQKKATPTDELNSFEMQPRRSHTVRPNVPQDRSRRRRSRSRRRRRGSRRRRSRSRRR